MYVNISKLELEKRVAHDGHTVLEIGLQTPEMRWAVHPMLHCQKHIDHLVAQLRGEIPYLERYAFEDISYVIMAAGVDGIHVWHRDGGELRDLYFHFPGCEVADIIERLNPSEDHPDHAEVGMAQIEQWAKQYGPRIRMDFAPEAKERFLGIVRGTCEGAELIPPEQRRDLVGRIRQLAHIAKNQSNGEAWTIHIRNDFARHSFYWWIETPDGRQFYNGGIIAHPLRSKEPADASWHEREVIGYEFSTHT